MNNPITFNVNYKQFQIDVPTFFKAITCVKFFDTPEDAINFIKDNLDQYATKEQGLNFPYEEWIQNAKQEKTNPKTNVVIKNSKKHETNKTERYSKSAQNTQLFENINLIKSKTIDKVVKKVDAKIKKRELLSFKAELAKEHKSIDDYTNEEVDLILLDKREKIIVKIKDKSLLGLLIALIIGI